MPTQSFTASISFHFSVLCFELVPTVFSAVTYVQYFFVQFQSSYLRQSDNGQDPARIRHLLMKGDCYCHRSRRRPCFSKFSGQKEGDLNSFVKVFWELEKPAQDEFVTCFLSS